MISWNWHVPVLREPKNISLITLLWHYISANKHTTNKLCWQLFIYKCIYTYQICGNWHQLAKRIVSLLKHKKTKTCAHNLIKTYVNHHFHSFQGSLRRNLHCASTKKAYWLLMQQKLSKIIQWPSILTGNCTSQSHSHNGTI